MNSQEFRVHGKHMIDLAAEYVETIEKRSVLSKVKPGYLKDLIPANAPDEPDKCEDLISDIERVIMPGITHSQSPHFHFSFPAASSFPATLADILSDTIGCTSYNWVFIDNLLNFNISNIESKIAFFQ